MLVTPVPPISGLEFTEVSEKTKPRSVIVLPPSATTSDAVETEVLVSAEKSGLTAAMVGGNVSDPMLTFTSEIPTCWEEPLAPGAVSRSDVQTMVKVVPGAILRPVTLADFSAKVPSSLPKLSAGTDWPATVTVYDGKRAMVPVAPPLIRFPV
jgi:hypothetical protein